MRNAGKKPEAGSQKGGCLLCLNPPLFDHQSRDRKGATGFISALSHGSLPYGRGSDRGLRQSR
ncbi:MAG: hypothetical protein FWD61_09360 [Phycisphaerales bacterium]|nr:hypothetical protein [Phycisphaerales bacterium]